MKDSVSASSATGPKDRHLSWSGGATRERLATQHLPLVHRLCQRYRHSGVPMEDLSQIGSIGLLKAIDKFDPERGTDLVAFAIPVTATFAVTFIASFSLTFSLAGLFQVKIDS